MVDVSPAFHILTGLPYSSGMEQILIQCNYCTPGDEPVSKAITESINKMYIMKKKSALSEINNASGFSHPCLLITGLPLSFLFKWLIQTTCIAVFSMKLCAVDLHPS